MCISEDSEGSDMQVLLHSSWSSTPCLITRHFA